MRRADPLLLSWEDPLLMRIFSFHEKIPFSWESSLLLRRFSPHGKIPPYEKIPSSWEDPLLMRRFPLHEKIFFSWESSLLLRRFPPHEKILSSRKDSLVMRRFPLSVSGLLDPRSGLLFSSEMDAISGSSIHPVPSFLSRTDPPPPESIQSRTERRAKKAWVKIKNKCFWIWYRDSQKTWDIPISLTTYAPLWINSTQ